MLCWYKDEFLECKIFACILVLGQEFSRFVVVVVVKLNDYYGKYFYKLGFSTLVQEHFLHIILVLGHNDIFHFSSWISNLEP